MGAGAASSLVGCPAELLMIQQQKSGQTLTAEARRIVSTYGVLGLYRGLVSTLLQCNLTLPHSSGGPLNFHRLWLADVQKDGRLQLPSVNVCTQAAIWASARC